MGLEEDEKSKQEGRGFNELDMLWKRRGPG